MMFGLFRRRAEVTQFHSSENKPIGALFAFDGDIRKKLIADFRERFQESGASVKSGGEMCWDAMKSIGLASGALGGSAFLGSKLYVATACASTLMKVGGGVSSTVVMGGKIVACAPFVPVVGAVIPVVAPILGFVVISHLTTLRKFKQIERDLASIRQSLHELNRRNEAMHLGEILSAQDRLDEIEAMFSVSMRFSQDMVVRLAVMESRVGPLMAGYRLLSEDVDINASTPIAQIRQKSDDAYRAIALSMLDLRIHILRIRAGMQDNVSYSRILIKSLVRKVAVYEQLWSSISQDDAIVDGLARELKSAVARMGWWKRNAPFWLLGARGNRVRDEGLVRELEGHVNRVREVSPASLSAKGRPFNLVAWTDSNGVQCYYTTDLQVTPAAGSVL